MARAASGIPLDVTTYREGWLRLRGWVCFSALAFWTGALLVLYELVCVGELACLLPVCASYVKRACSLQRGTASQRPLQAPASCWAACCSSSNSAPRARHSDCPPSPAPLGHHQRAGQGRPRHAARLPGDTARHHVRIHAEAPALHTLPCAARARGASHPAVPVLLASCRCYRYMCTRPAAPTPQVPAQALCQCGLLLP